MKFAYFLTFAITAFLIEQILIDYPGKGQSWLYDTIIFSFTGMIAAGYVITLVSIRRETRGPRYPSTVRSRIQGGLRRGTKS